MESIGVKKSPWSIAVAVACWIIIAAIGFWAIPLTIDIALRIYVPFTIDRGHAFNAAYWGGTAIRSILALILGTIYVIVVIGSAEYTFRFLGQPKSWRVLSSIIAAEIGLLVLSTLV